MTSNTARSFLAIAGLALVACGGEPEGEAPGPDASPAAAPAPAPAATAPSPAPATAATIPARFLGVWDAETGTCDPASDLRLDIAAQTITFYESQGTLTRLAEAIDGSTVVELAMEGEGEQWNMRMTLSLSGTGAGERLNAQHRSESSEPAPEPLRYKRCPV